MNWFTRSIVIGLSLEQKKKLVETHGGCSHVTDKSEKLYAISYENDSFGREGYCMCKNCWDSAEEKEGENDVVCNDCHRTIKAKDSIEWKWYDFYAPQGDIPLIICKDCEKKEKHIKRKESDDYYRNLEND